jgi:hypothetical protein
MVSMEEGPGYVWGQAGRLGRQGDWAGRATHCLRLFEELVGFGISRFIKMSYGELEGLLPAGARGAAETGGLWFTQPPPAAHVSN